jgi:hypothetical protein
VALGLAIGPSEPIAAIAVLLLQPPPAMPVLSQEDLEFFEENGYVVAKSVISKEQAAKTAQRVWTYANQDADDPETWYTGGGIMIEMYQSQEQWDNRQAPLVHEAFSQVWGQEELRVSRDRASINPPALDRATALDSQVAFGLHFDTGFAQQTVAEAKQQRPIAKGVQGVLYLVDTPAENVSGRTATPSPGPGLLTDCVLPSHGWHAGRLHLCARHASPG